MNGGTLKHRIWRAIAGVLLAAAALPAANAGSDSAEVATSAQSTAAALKSTPFAVTSGVDCQLPGKLQALGGMRIYLTPGVLTRLPAIDCRTRGGQYR